MEESVLFPLEKIRVKTGTVLIVTVFTAAPPARQARAMPR
jgi:hypothetical protein